MSAMREAFEKWFDSYYGYPVPKVQTMVELHDWQVWQACLQHIKDQGRMVRFIRQVK